MLLFILFLISYFLFLISYFLFLISYFLFLISYFLFLISYFLFLISYFLFLISYFLFLISYFLFLISYFFIIYWFNFLQNCKLLFLIIYKQMSALFKEQFGDFPFECEVLERFERLLPEIVNDNAHGVLIAGTCDGSIIGVEDKKVFFKASYDKSSYSFWSNEIGIFNILGRHSFIPKFYGTRMFGRYRILFMEYIEGSNLWNLPTNSDIWKLKLEETLNKIIFLYEKYKFVHNDISTDNIILDKNNNIYIIDFEMSTIGISWTEDLLSMIPRLKEDDIHTNFDELLSYLKNNKNDTNIDNYKKAVDVLMSYLY
jgi:predicted Ser/Thr protein kinase